MIAFLISLAIAVFLVGTVHRFARNFVRNKLRYVDAARKSIAPWLAGGAVALVGSPIALLLPFVGTGTVVSVAVAAGLGVAAGAKDISEGRMPVVYDP